MVDLLGRKSALELIPNPVVLGQCMYGGGIKVAVGLNTNVEGDVQLNNPAG